MLNLPNEFAIGLANGVTPIGQIDCVARTPQTASFIVKAPKPAATSSPALKAAHAKLKADRAKLAAAKKALKKAKGHKKVVLKKKVAKLAAAVKKDQAKVKSLSK